MGWRAFVGIPVTPSPALLALHDALAQSDADLKLVRPENLHVTVAFLGTVADEAAEPLGAALSRAAAGLKPFDSVLEGAGGFPNARRPRVVWVGLRPPEPLAQLAGRVKAELDAAGHPGDDKPFRAHVTLARARSPRGSETVARLLQEHADAPMGALPVRDIRLYRSTLGPHGPTYEPIVTVPLKVE